MNPFQARKGTKMQADLISVVSLLVVFLSPVVLMLIGEVLEVDRFIVDKKYDTSQLYHD